MPCIGLAQVASDERDVTSRVWVRVNVDEEFEGDTTAPPIVHMERTHSTESTRPVDSQEIGKPNQPMNTQIESGMRRRRATRGNNTVEEDQERSIIEKKRSINKKMDTVLTGIVGMPSSEIREAAKCFTLAIDRAIALVSATSRVDSLLHDASPSDQAP